MSIAGGTIDNINKDAAIDTAHMVFGEGEMFDPNFQELVAVMARDVAVRTTQEGRALDLALAVLTVLAECGTITGADVCHLATAVGYDAEAISSAWKTRAGYEGLHAKGLDAPLARVLPLG